MAKMVWSEDPVCDARMELAVKAKAKRRHLSAEDCPQLGRSPEGTNALTRPNNVTQRNYDPHRGLHPRTPKKRLRLGVSVSPDNQQKGITDFFSVTKVVSSSMMKSAQQPQVEDEDDFDDDDVGSLLAEVEDEEDDNDDDNDISLLANAVPLVVPLVNGMPSAMPSTNAMPLANRLTSHKQEEKINYLEGITAEMWDDDEFDDEGGDDISLSQETCNQLGGEDEDLTQIDYVEALPIPYYGLLGNSDAMPLVVPLANGMPSAMPSTNAMPFSNRLTSHKQEEKINYLEGITAEMWDDDQFDDEGGDDISLSQETCNQLGGEDEDLTQIDDVEALPDPCYGLLGNSDHLVEPQVCADDLPAEVLRKVLSLLPAQVLYRHAALVCHSWNDIIQDPEFAPLKKQYYRYRMGEKTALSAVRRILEESCVLLDTNVRQQTQSVCQLVSLMAQHATGERVWPEDIQRCVQRHHLFPQAEACITSRFPDIPQIGANRTYAAMALILLLSETVKDVQVLVSHLQGTITHSAITEFLSEMATFLLALDRNNIWISNRLHYNIYYILHLMENAPTPIYINHSRTQLPMTHEQHQILSHDIQNNQVVKVMAFAGTGKTTTLVRYAQQRPHLKFLYVAFNKSVAVEAQKRFPANVICKTIHSMAYGAVGKIYTNKLGSDLKAWNINRVLPKGRGGFINSKVVMQTLKNYMASVDRCINTSHVPPTCKNSKGVVVELDTEKLKGYVDDAKIIWDKMKNPNEWSQDGYSMPHDGYLKLWQLQNPCLSQYMSIDVIFVDEAQDCTPAVLDIVLSPPCGKILVGDPHQQIYTFRGAVNALHMVEHTHIYYLTQSFRFGAEIAYVAATILRVGKGIKRKILVGGNQPSTFCDESTYPLAAMSGSEGVSVQGKTAILCRTNTCVFSEAVKLTDANPSCRIHFVGGSMEESLRKILDIWKLMGADSAITESIHDPVVRNFHYPKMGGFSGLKKYADETEDLELAAKVAVVEKYTVRIPELVERLNTCFESQMSNADFIVGTVHKAKGLEFDTVIITDDFAKVPCERHNLGHFAGISWSRIPVDEWNLLYVAVTRAKTNLIVSHSVGHILTQAGEYCLRSEMIGSVMQEGQPPPCSVRLCQNFIMADSAFAMCKRPMRYADIVEAGGPLCERCVWQRIGPTAFLQSENIFQQPKAEENPVLPQVYARIY